jgi:hypothetical protein
MHFTNLAEEALIGWRITVNFCRTQLAAPTASSCRGLCKRSAAIALKVPHAYSGT